MSTSESVVDILVNEGGYRVLPQPMKVGSGSFEFSHALVGSNTANDLVVVVEIKPDTSDDLIVRNILGLTRALDVLRSRRSLTAVLTSGPAAPETLRSISRVCRVLPVGSPQGPKAADTVRVWLAALLPLGQHAGSDINLDWVTELRGKLPKTTNLLTETLITCAPDGASDVEAAFGQAIKAVVTATLAEDNAADEDEDEDS